jgi:hypothetical protein
LAIQEMDTVALEMQMVGASSAYFLQLYLEYLGRYALEIFTSVHIKSVHSLWWRRTSISNPEFDETAPDCSCSPVQFHDDFEIRDDDVEYSDMVNENETMEIED